MQRLAPALLLVLVITSAAVSQELSTEVYPSEDELYLALAAGDIDYHQFLILREAIRTGIDATLGAFKDDQHDHRKYHTDGDLDILGSFRQVRSDAPEGIAFFDPWICHNSES